ncbi:MAG TPA: ACP S-malonyltransferase [Kofleriaceae bacterium]|nr:ACP S-malonyltransferase [Kofleriaceae bacterium]
MLAYVYPGQGSQFVGMGRALAQSYAVARRTYEEADEVLGFALSKLCFDGPGPVLDQTIHAQPAILATSIAGYRVLTEETGLQPAIVAGHSLGEITAFTCAGALTLEQALRLVYQRGSLMQEAVPVGAGAMAAIIGLDPEDVEALCREAAQGEVVSIANDNGAQQLVIAGNVAAVQRAQALAEARQAVTRPLHVSGPFHCSLMAPAALGLAHVLSKIAFQAPRVPVIDGIDGALHRDANGIADLLAREVSAPLRWDACMRRMRALSIDTAVEIGCGNRLTSMIRRAEPGIRTLSFGTPEDLAQVADLARDRPLLVRPLGHWQILDGGHLHARAESSVVWAGSSQIEPIDGEHWNRNTNGTWIRRYGAMALVGSDERLRVFEPDAWYPREDGAYARTDRTEVISPTGESETFSPEEWELSTSGAWRRRDGTRTIWPDGSEWGFDPVSPIPGLSAA